MELESLRSKVKEYENRSTIAKEKVDSVRKSIDLQKKALSKIFSKGIDVFTDTAKDNIKNQIDLIAQFRLQKENIKESQLTEKVDDPSWRTDNFLDLTIKIAEDCRVRKRYYCHFLP